jgi:hypothetical protein
MSKLDEMRAERARLDIEIETAERNARADWNFALVRLQEALDEWLAEKGIEHDETRRKNVFTWDIGHGALLVYFAEDTGQWPSDRLHLTSGGGLSLDWYQELPAAERFLQMVAACLNTER